MVVFISFGLGDCALFVYNAIPRDKYGIASCLPVDRVFHGVSTFYPTCSTLWYTTKYCTHHFTSVGIGERQTLLTRFLLPFIIADLLTAHYDLLYPRKHDQLLSIILIECYRLLTTVYTTEDRCTAAVLYDRALARAVLIRTTAVIQLGYSFRYLVFVCLLLFALLNYGVARGFLGSGSLDLF